MSQSIFADLQSPFPAASSPGGEAPPPYSTLPGDPVESGMVMWGSPMAGPVSSPYCQMSRKLNSMDFIPRIIRKRLIGKNEYETFSSLVDRANSWLDEHSDVQLISCETLTWFGVSHKDIFSDSSSFRKVPSTTFMRGLRFWYMTNVIPSPNRGVRNSQVVQCQTFAARPTETFTVLMTRVNEHLSTAAAVGRILTVETVRMNLVDGSIRTEDTFWKEDIGDTKQVSFAFRIFTILSSMQGYEAIGYQDFVPSRTNRNKDNKGFELYADLMDRATRWIARQQGVRFTNVQTIGVKIKKNVTSEERCTFTEHGQRATNFLNVIRAYFVIQHGGGGAPAAPSADTRLTYRTFSPFQIATDRTGVASSNVPAKYEDMRGLLERINHWLQLTGAKLFSIETLPVRVPSDKFSPTLGPEATFLNNREDGAPSGRFLFHIRIYLTGDYTEPPNAVGIMSTQMSVVSVNAGGYNH